MKKKKQNPNVMVLTSCRLRAEQVVWLKAHGSFNFAGFVREKLDERIKQEEPK